MKGPFLNRKGDLSIMKGGLLCMQLILSIMDYACPRVLVYCSHPYPEATHATIQVYSPYYFCPWQVSNRQLHEDQVVALSADHIKAWTASFDSNLANVRDPLVQ
jgi:hypothetical protein